MFDPNLQPPTRETLFRDQNGRVSTMRVLFIVLLVLAKLWVIAWLVFNVVRFTTALS